MLINLCLRWKDAKFCDFGIFLIRNSPYSEMLCLKSLLISLYIQQEIQKAEGAEMSRTKEDRDLEKTGIGRVRWRRAR